MLLNNPVAPSFTFFNPKNFNMLNGRLSLVTPEGVRLLLTPAGPAARAWAWAVDILAYLTLLFILALITSGSKLGTGVYLIGLFVVYWGYPIICEVYFGGRTLGKRMLGLRVVRSDGLPVGWRESVLRNLVMVADFLPFFYMTGLLCMLFDVQFRRLGDLVAGTQVIYEDALSQRREIEVVEPEVLPYPLNPEQQRTLIGLFEREKNIPIERLNELGSYAEPLTGLSGAASLARLRAYVAGMKL